MPIRSEFEQTIGRFIQDTAEKLGASDIGQCLEAALEQYGVDRPLIVSLDVVGNGTSDILLSALTNLDDRYLLHDVYGLRIEYPIAAVGSYPTPLFRESWLFYQKPTGNAVRLLGATPTALESIRFTYRARYFIDLANAALTTVWQADYFAFCKLAAAEGCEMLARLYTQTVDKNPQADFTSFTSKGSEFTSRAKVLRDQYKAHIAGLKSGPVTLQLTYDGITTSDWPLDDYYA